MKLRILTLLIYTLLLPFQLVHADIAADLKANLSLEKVLNNALAEGLTIDQAVGRMVALAPNDAGNIVRVAVSKSPSAAGNIVAAATLSANKLTPPGRVTDPIVAAMIAAITSAAVNAAPRQTAAIVTAANTAAPAYQNSISRAAIAAGADPGVVTAATAAGIVVPGPAPAAPTAAPTAAPSGGGGGVASPS